MRTFELGDLIAEQRLAFEADAGLSREVWVRLGRPVADSSDDGRSWLCPYQIAGLDHDRVMAIFGVDAMQALVLAIHTIPAELSAFTKNPGGRFLYLDHPDVDFLHACRVCIETVGDVFPDGAPAGREHLGGARKQFFVNVDLDIDSAVDPAPLVRALEPFAYSLERPVGRASFELNVPVAPTSPEPLIREFIRLVGNMSLEARALWDGASRRVFDVGFQSLRQPFSETHPLSVDTLTKVAEVGAEIAVTVYSLAEEDDEEVAG
jgi:uncharacterized protein DUF6968